MECAKKDCVIKSIIYITEKNVDGCGSNASDLYGIDHTLTEEERAQLTTALAETKKMLTRTTAFPPGI